MAQSVSHSGARTLSIVIILAILAAVAFVFLTQPDRRTTGQKIGDAVDALPQGVDKAADQLESRTPGQKIGDAVEDTGERIKEHTDNPRD